MSGPKSASYYLTLPQRQILEQKRRKLIERQRTVRQEIKHIQQKIPEISAQNLLTAQKLQNYRERAAKTAECCQYENGVLPKVQTLQQVLEKLDFCIQNAMQTETLPELRTEYQNLLLQTQKRDTLLKEIEILDEQNTEQLFRHRVAMHQEYDSAVRKSDTLDFGHLRTDAQKKLDECRDPVLHHLRQASARELLSDALKTELKTAENTLYQLDSPALIKNFHALTVMPLVRKCEEYAEIYDQFQSTQTQYEILCQMAEIPPRHFDCTRSALMQMETEVSALEERIAKAEEQSYISRCIDEVMQEMGFPLLGTRSVTKKSGKKFHNELYTFEEGTAVSITYADDGKITMELGGLAEEDRIPAEEETAFLCEQMEQFCTEFTEFERRLFQKGICSRHIALLPPEASCAQIINMTEYELKTETQPLHVPEQKHQPVRHKEKRML